MKCEAEGKIIKVLGKRVGKTAKGKEWESMDYLLEEDNDIYHYKLMFTMTSFDGPIMDEPRLGDRVKVSFTVQAREWKDKWFNGVHAHEVVRVNG